MYKYKSLQRRVVVHSFPTSDWLNVLLFSVLHHMACGKSGFEEQVIDTTATCCILTSYNTWPQVSIVILGVTSVMRLIYCWRASLGHCSNVLQVESDNTLSHYRAVVPCVRTRQIRFWLFGEEMEIVLCSWAASHLTVTVWYRWNFCFSAVITCENW